MAAGKVVDHNETGIRYAVSERNYNEKIHTFVRDLKPGESVLTFQPKPKGSLVEDDDTQNQLDIGTESGEHTSPEEISAADPNSTPDSDTPSKSKRK